MKIKSAVAGLVFATSMIVIAGTSQANCGSRYCPVAEGFYGIGWNMVPCNDAYQPARTWDQYVSGGYLPPQTGHGFFR